MSDTWSLTKELKLIKINWGCKEQVNFKISYRNMKPLGFSNYYHCFIKKYSQEVKPLHTLMLVNIASSNLKLLNWTPECETTFRSWNNFVPQPPSWHMWTSLGIAEHSWICVVLDLGNPVPGVEGQRLNY